MSDIRRESDSLATKYTESTVFRASVQSIPYVGAALDTLMAWRGSNLQKKRVEKLLDELDKAMCALDAASVQYADFETEEGADLLMASMRSAARHRSQRRIAALADIISKRAQGFKNWDEAEEAVRLVDGLQDIDLELIFRSNEFKLLNGIFAGTSTFTVGDSKIYRGTRIVTDRSEPKTLCEEFSDHDPLQLRLACQRLTSYGFIRDEGIGRLDANPGDYLGFTDSAGWLHQWLTEGRLAENLKR